MRESLATKSQNLNVQKENSKKQVGQKVLKIS